mgnify:CR=1 FL=1
MKHIIYGLGIASLSLFLSGCGSKQEKVVEVDPAVLIENLEVSDEDMNKFDIIVWGEWVSEVDETNVFTFGWQNTFTVIAGYQQAAWPRIVSEGKILLWEEQMELIILDPDTITIQWRTYIREPQQ